VLKKYIQTSTLKNWKLKHHPINSTDRKISEDKCLHIPLVIPFIYLGNIEQSPHLNSDVIPGNFKKPVSP
jgi:hypothetical protein